MFEHGTLGGFFEWQLGYGGLMLEHGPLVGFPGGLVRGPLVGFCDGLLRNSPVTCMFVNSVLVALLMLASDGCGDFSTVQRSEMAK